MAFRGLGLSTELVEQSPLGKEHLHPYRLKAGEMSAEDGEGATRKDGPDAEFFQEAGGDGVDEEDLDERGVWSDFWTVKCPEEPGQTLLCSGYHGNIR